MSTWFDLPRMEPLAPDADYPLFNRFSLETHSKCNRACSFCPVSSGRRDFVKPMDWALLTRIVDELARLGYDGIMSMFLLNEPLINKRFVAELQYVREKLPRCSAYVSTNGDVLAAAKDPAAKLAEYYDAGATTVNLNVYDAGSEQYDRYWRIVCDAVDRGVADYTEHKYRRHAHTKRMIAFSDMRVDRPGGLVTDMFYTRTSEERSRSPERKAKWCMRPFRHMVVLWDGRVPVCCAVDPTAEDLVVAGDVRERSVAEVWSRSDVFRRYRYHLQQKKRDLPSCDTCDHTMQYAWVYRHVAVTEAERERWARQQEDYLVSLEEAREGAEEATT